jgi:aspartate/methionine/tyrosine aminotransferase
MPTEPAPPTEPVAPPTQPAASRRVRATDAPVVAKTKALIASAREPSKVASLAQGVVHWPPPPSALRAAARLSADAARGDAAAGALLHSYGPTPGYPPLRAALRRRMAALGLPGYSPVVTPGANSAFAIAVLALCDEGDAVALFPPLYFNHKMAVQMTGGSAGLMLAPLRADLRPDLAWLERACRGEETSGGRPPRVVVLVNPANPTGVALARDELDRAAEATRRAGAWLVVDNTYADFTYDGREHYCPAGGHVVHVFSMSKAYGMMGWRVGWIGLPPPPPPPPDDGGAPAAADAAAAAASAAAAEDLGDGGALMDEVLKVQDSIPICATQLSQAVALAALEGDGDDDGGDGRQQHPSADFGDAYVSARVAELARANRRIVREALTAALGAESVLGGEGGIYFFARLPAAFAERARTRASGDDDVVAWLVRHSGVCVLPGSACAAPGWLRVAFANLPAGGPCEEAAARLQGGLAELVRRGVAALDDGGAD